MATIFCDEAGNSGANLPDPDQPFFVLASNDFGAEEAERLLDHVRSSQGGEPKFTTLKKSPDGVRRLIQFLADPRLNRARVFADVYHKRFMIVTKMVDIIVETLIHKMGGDLYERGANIAMSNMLYYCMPTFCGEENTDRLLRSFVQLVRRRGEEDAAAFFEAGRAMVESSSDVEFKESLVWFSEPVGFDAWFTDTINSQALDPAIPSLFQHIVTWGSRKVDRFAVIHDRSKPILASQETFEEMMAMTGEEPSMIGYDRRKIMFPLRALSLEQADSKDHPQLQVADLCAGVVNHYYKCLITQGPDELANAARDLGCADWVSGGVLPSKDVTPEALGTDSPGGSNSVERMVEYMSQRAARKSG